MNNYYLNLNSQSNTGDNEVHREGCVWLATVKNKKPLGRHQSCHSAVTLAKQYRVNADGCKYCCPHCHTS